MIGSDPWRAGAGGAQAHPAPDPYQALGLGGRYRHGRCRSCGAGRPPRAGERRWRASGYAPVPVRIAEAPKCASDPRVVCALQYGSKPERRGYRPAHLRRIAPLVRCRRAPLTLGDATPASKQKQHSLAGSDDGGQAGLATAGRQHHTASLATESSSDEAVNLGVILYSSPIRWVPYAVLASLPRSFLHGQEGVVGLRIEQDALPFIVPHHPAIRPQNPPRDRLGHRAPPEPASATAHLPPSLRLRAFGLGSHAQIQLDRELVSPFPGHLRLCPWAPGETADCRLGRCGESMERPPGSRTFSALLPVGCITAVLLPFRAAGVATYRLSMSLPSVCSTCAGRHLSRVARRPTDDCARSAGNTEPYGLHARALGPTEVGAEAGTMVAPSPMPPTGPDRAVSRRASGRHCPNRRARPVWWRCPT